MSKEIYLHLAVVCPIVTNSYFIQFQVLTTEVPYAGSLLRGSISEFASLMSMTISVENMSRGFCTLRKLILITGIFLALKVSWNTFKAFTYVPPPLDLSEIPDKDFNMDFKPGSCVIENGVCKPVEDTTAPFPGKGLYAKGHHFYLDGRPFRIFSGSFHYFRTHPAQWGDRLLKMRAAGLNTVMTYIPWNLHEPVKGQYMLGGQWDIASFIQMVQRVGMKMIVRPGPYICAEWEFGGLPAWLLSDPNMKVRTSDYKPYLDHVDAYFSHLFSLLTQYTYKKAGPIIAFQIENEFGSQKRKDVPYLKFLEKQFYKWGIEELLFTSDGSKQLPNGTLPNILATVNFNKWPEEKLGILKKFQPNKPLMVTEFWSGWFDHWGSKHHVLKLDQFEQILDVILRMNSSVNFYMFVGGTNFGHWSGGPFGDKVITSYDYDAPISECGDITPKFHVIRKMILKYSLAPLDLPDIPKNSPKVTYGKVSVSSYLPYEELVGVMLKLHSSQGARLTLPQPQTMERLQLGGGVAQNQGFLMYRKKIAPGSRLEFTGHVADRAQILVNGEEIRLLNASHAGKAISISMKPSPDAAVNLDILVENMGRVNFKPDLNDQHKGIQGQIILDGQVLSDWLHVPFQWEEQVIDGVLSSNDWLDFPNMAEGSTLGPGLYRIFLDISGKPEDSFMDMTGWTKGLVIVNGFNIGRYWNIGPQKHLYVPAPLLRQGMNTILIFELHLPGSSVSLLDVPSLGETEEMKVELERPNKGLM